MSVYVDDFKSPRLGRLHGWCHLVADTDEELHAFADKIGLKREWFQPHSIMNHYDVSVGKRTQAIKAGAIPIGYKELNRKCLPELYNTKGGVMSKNMMKKITRDVWTISFENEDDNSIDSFKVVADGIADASKKAEKILRLMEVKNYVITEYSFKDDNIEYWEERS